MSKPSRMAMALPCRRPRVSFSLAQYETSIVTPMSAKAVSWPFLIKNAFEDAHEPFSSSEPLFAKTATSTKLAATAVKAAKIAIKPPESTPHTF